MRASNPFSLVSEEEGSEGTSPAAATRQLITQKTTGCLCGTQQALVVQAASLSVAVRYVAFAVQLLSLKSPLWLPHNPISESQKG